MKKIFTAIAAVCVLLNCISTAAAQVKIKKKPATKTTAAAAPAEEELVAVTPEKGKEIIAVYPFTTSGYTYYDYALNAASAVESGFLHSKRFKVVERSRFGVVRQEDAFKELNTQEVVRKASKLGAKIVVTGNVMAVSNVQQYQTGPFPVTTYTAQINLTFKIIDVASAEITKSENILASGKGGTPAEAIRSSYEDLDRQARAQVADYLPQRFEYASEVEIDKKNRLKKFKIWGGSDQGLKEKDMVEIYRLSYTINPRTNKKVEEKKLIGTAKIVEINSIESSTCELQKSGDIGESLLAEIKTKPETIVFEYKGSAKKGGLFGL